MECNHKDQIKDVKPKTPEGCEECLKEGVKWVELRKCLTCGHIGCCDSSEGKHSTKHFKKTSHPIIESYGSDKIWRWCFIDNDYVK